MSESMSDTFMVGPETAASSTWAREGSSAFFWRRQPG